MASQDERAALLVRDVLDVIELGSYGLYELIWTLNGQSPELSEVEKLAAAMQAVTELIGVHELRLVRLRWPSEKAEGEITLADIGAQDFESPDPYGSYMALAHR